MKYEGARQARTRLQEMNETTAMCYPICIDRMLNASHETQAGER
jgi:hypothetical protein